MTQIKKQRIDWETIKIVIVPADKKNPNPLNPYADLSAKEREDGIVSLCGRIWARAMKAEALKLNNQNISNPLSKTPLGKG